MTAGERARSTSQGSSAKNTNGRRFFGIPMTIALGKSSWLVMKCQHETLQWGALAPPRPSRSTLSSQLRSGHQPSWPSQFVTGGRRISLLRTERDSAAMQYHDSRPLELPSWQKSSPYKLICIRESGQAIVHSLCSGIFQGQAGVECQDDDPPSLCSPSPQLQALNHNHGRVRGSDPLVAAPSQTSS